MWIIAYLSQPFGALCGFSTDGYVESGIANSFDNPLILFDDPEDFDAFIHFAFHIR